MVLFNPGNESIRVGSVLHWGSVPSVWEADLKVQKCAVFALDRDLEAIWAASAIRRDGGAAVGEALERDKSEAHHFMRSAPRAALCLAQQKGLKGVLKPDCLNQL